MKAMFKGAVAISTASYVQGTMEIGSLDVKFDSGSSDPLVVDKAWLQGILSRLDALELHNQVNDPSLKYINLGCKMVRQTGGGKGAVAVATCPTGYEVTGGGFHDIDQDGAGSTGDEFASWPDDTGRGWKVQFDDEVGGFDSFAICCRSETANGSAHPAFQLTCATAEIGGGTGAVPIGPVACASGSTHFGAGFNDIDQGAADAGDEFNLRPDANGWFLQFAHELGGFQLRTRCCKYEPIPGGPALPNSYAPVMSCRNVAAGGGSASVQVYAQCASDEMIVGGGFGDIDQNGGGSSADEFDSCPSQGNDCSQSHDMSPGEQWYVRFDDEVGGFTSYARCCKKTTTVLCQNGAPC